MAGEMHQSPLIGVSGTTVDLLLTSAVHTRSVSIGSVEGADPTSSSYCLGSPGQISIGMYPVYSWIGYFYFYLLKGGVMSEIYRSQLHSDAQEKKKRLYIKRCFISLRCHLAVKRKAADVIPTKHCPKFVLKAMFCPHPTCIVPEGPGEKALLQTAGY